MRNQVDYTTPTILLEMTSKSSSFLSGIFALNNNKNVAIVCSVLLTTGLDASLSVQGSLDKSTWIDLNSTSVTITGTDDVLWTMSELHGLLYLRVSVTINSGSGIFYISARGS